MPLLADRIQETTTTGGTGTLTLGGAVTGYRTFAASFTVGQALYYTIDNGAGEWEIGVGTLVTSGTLSRDTVIESSNSNALVNFAAGTAKRVFCSAPTKVLLPNQTGNSGKVLSTDGSTPSWTTTLNGFTIGNVTPGSGAFTTLSATSTVSGSGFSTYLASPPAIGGTTPAAGNFTTLGATGNVTLGDAAGDTLTINAGTTTFAQGTANGVLYLNGSKVATSGSALTFDGTNLGVGTATPTFTAGGGIQAKNASFVSFRATGGASTGIDFAQASDGKGYIFNRDNADILFGLNNAEQMRLTSTGLGIGTSSPGAKLDVYGGTVHVASGGTIKSNGYLVDFSTSQQSAGISFSISSPTAFLDLYAGGDPVNTGGWSGAIRFLTGGTNALGTERMRLDSSGNLGIGTSSNGTGTKVEIRGANTITNARGVLAVNTTDAAATNVGGSISLGGENGQTITPLVFGSIAGRYEGSGYAGYLQFSTISPGGTLSEHMRLDSSGQCIWKPNGTTSDMTLDANGSLLVGTTSSAGSAYTLQVKGAWNFTDSSGTPVCFYNPSNGYIYLAPVYDKTTANAANVYVGSAPGDMYRSTSALKYKQDIRDLESVDINKFRAVRYKSKCENDDQTKDHFGIIADEVLEAGFPELVILGADGEPEGFQYERLTAVLVKAIQELTARLEALEAK